MITQELESSSIKIQKDFDTSRVCLLRVGAKVRYAIYPESREQLETALHLAKKNEIQFRVLGNLSNCIVGPNYSDRMIIFTEKLKSLTFDMQKGVIYAGAGVMLPVMAKLAVERGLMGFEGLVGIPGTVGGALYMNAGAYGNEISDVLNWVEIIDPTGQFKVLTKDQLHFSWRHSTFQEKQGTIVVGAEFSAKTGTISTLKEKMEWCRKNRRTYQENRYPNLGSLFKTRDIYSEIAKRHKAYAVMLFFIRKLTRFTGRENNRLLNFMTTRFFGLNWQGPRPYSDKTLNCLVNRGTMTIEAALRYINWMQALGGPELHLEIEIFN